MAILFMLASFAGYKLFILVTRNNPAVSQQSFLKDLDAEPPFLPYNDSLGQGGFGFSFGVGKPIDPRIGFYAVNEVSFYYSKNETDPTTG